MRFGTTNTRYKDAFDIYYLKNTARADVIKQYIEKYIYGDETMNVNSANDVYNRLKNILTNEAYISAVKRSKKNWIGVPVEQVLQENLLFFYELI